MKRSASCFLSFVAVLSSVGCMGGRGRSRGVVDVDSGPSSGFDGGTVVPGEDGGTVVPERDGGRTPVERDAWVPPPGVDAGPIDPPPPVGYVGTACASDADCGPDGYCIPGEDMGAPTGFVDGYCVTVGCDTTGCPAGSECYTVTDDGTTACLATCVSDSECRSGYACDVDTVCWPGCDASRPCPSSLTCTADGYCGGATPSGECSPTVPTGTCPSGLLCIDGACRTPPPCSSDPYEPNNSRTAATALPVGTSVTAGRCSSDDDWWRIDVPAGQVVNVLATFPAPTTANLDLYAYRSDGTMLGGRVDGAEPTPSWARVYETNEEGFGFYASSSARTYYVKVTGATSSVSGSYTLRATSTPWRDGPTCTGASFTSLECTGGTAGAQTLISFPFNDTGDPYNLGYFFDSLTNYRYLRRETIMAVRYGIHEVTRQFAGTTGLGLIDMCQRDAITPGYDIGDPRHPATTHDQGGNIDVAYYQTVSDNHARVICDASGGSVTSDGGWCAPSAASTHIVDLRRSVYFVVALTRTGRLRVVGLDRVIGPLMVTEAGRMRDSGVITRAEYDAFVAHTVWGDGWPFHHHHMHVSMTWL